VLKLGLRAASCAAWLLAQSAATAQTGASIGVTTDYRYRGVSLSDERPALRLGLSHDVPDGWYAGASLATVRLDPPRGQWQVLVFGGRALKLGESLGAEAGVLAVHFGADTRFDYHEFFVGLSGNRWSSRIYLSPDYFGSGLATAYAELDAGVPVAAGMRLNAHLGALTRLSGQSSADAGRLHFDARAGLAWRRPPWDWQLDCVATGRVGIYPVGYGHERGVLVMSATYAF
jgi:uncharacterized protein (TIGR02001 family)